MQDYIPKKPIGERIRDALEARAAEHAPPHVPEERERQPPPATPTWYLIAPNGNAHDARAMDLANRYVHRIDVRAEPVPIFGGIAEPLHPTIENLSADPIEIVFESAAIYGGGERIPAQMLWTPDGIYPLAAAAAGPTDVSDRAGRLLGIIASIAATVTADVTDRAGRLLGVISGAVDVTDRAARLLGVVASITNPVDISDRLARLVGRIVIRGGTSGADADVLAAAPGADTGQPGVAVRVISQLGAGSFAGGVVETFADLEVLAATMSTGAVPVTAYNIALPRLDAVAARRYLGGSARLVFDVNNPLGQDLAKITISVIDNEGAGDRTVVTYHLGNPVGAAGSSLYDKGQSDQPIAISLNLPYGLGDGATVNIVFIVAPNANVTMRARLELSPFPLAPGSANTQGPFITANGGSVATVVDQPGSVGALIAGVGTVVAEVSSDDGQTGWQASYLRKAGGPLVASVVNPATNDGPYEIVTWPGVTDARIRATAFTSQISVRFYRSPAIAPIGIALAKQGIAHPDYGLALGGIDGGGLFRRLLTDVLGDLLVDTVDRAGRLVGIVYGSVGQLAQKAASTLALATDTSLVVQLSPMDARAAVLVVTATGAVNAGVTATLPAPAAGLFHYITRIELVKLYSVVGVAAGAGVIITSTNLPGNPAWTTEQLASPAGTAPKVISEERTKPLKALAAATATTFVAPAQLQTIWRWNISYYTAP